MTITDEMIEVGARAIYEYGRPAVPLEYMSNEIQYRFRAQARAALEAVAPMIMEAERCDYCANGQRTGLPSNACENCMNTGLKYPELAK